MRETSTEALYNSPDQPYLLVLSANSAEALVEMDKNFNSYLNAHPERLLDLSYTLAVRRNHLPYRGYSVAKLSGALDSIIFSSGKATAQRDLAFVFTGQGAQWASMGARLFDINEIFKETIESLDAHLRSYNPPPLWSLAGKREFKDP